MFVGIKKHLKFKHSPNILLSLVLLLAISLSIFRMLQASTPNPGHPWSQVGDGNFAVAGPTVARTYIFPDADTTVLTTSTLVTVAQGGTGTSTLTGIIVGNGTNPLTATTTPVGLLVGDSAAQTLTNKTFVDASNTITDASAALGDLLKSNATKFVRFARGTANQMLRTNSGATDLEWATVSTAPSGSNTWIQYNNSSAFGASSSLTWDQTNKSLGINGYIEMSTSTLVSVPTNGSVRLFARKVAGRALPMIRTEVTDDYYALQPSFFQNYVILIGSGSGATFTNTGSNIVQAGTVTHQAVTEARGYMARFDTTTTLNTAAYVYSGNAMFYRGSTSGINGFFFVARVATDATLTSVRYFIGLTDQATNVPVATANPAGNRVGFAFATDLTETNWMFSTKDNTTESRPSTGVAVAANKVYDMYIYTPPQGSVIYWRLDNLTDSTSTEGSTASNLPTNSTAMRIYTGIYNITGVQRFIHMQKMYCEVPR